MSPRRTHTSTSYEGATTSKMYAVMVASGHKLPIGTTISSRSSNPVFSQLWSSRCFSIFFTS